MNKPTTIPCCPNHGEPLEGIPFPMPSKGIGICPVSGCPFDYEVEVDEEITLTDKFGNVTKAVKWNVSGDENSN